MQFRNVQKYPHGEASPTLMLLFPTQDSPFNAFRLPDT